MERLTNEDHKELGFVTYNGALNPYAVPLTIGELAGMICEDYSPKNILKEVFARLAAYEDAMPLERAKELARAEKDGRLVVLPCKKGDTLWSFYNYLSSGICKIAVTAVSTLDGIIVMNTDNYGVISEKDIGKGVFLTREEAEAALKKREVINETIDN